MAALLAGAYKPEANTITIDFTIRAETIPTVSYIDVLNGAPSVLQQIKGKKVIIGGTAIELGDRFSIPNGRIIPGVKLQVLAAESILQGRALRNVSIVVPLAAIAALFGVMMVMWRRTTAVRRVPCSYRRGRGLRVGGDRPARAVIHSVVDFSLLHLAVAAYLLAIALDEIDIRDLLGNIADTKFRHIAMSLGDGLVCADHSGHITLWNPGRDRDLRLRAPTKCSASRWTISSRTRNGRKARSPSCRFRKSNFSSPAAASLSCLRSERVARHFRSKPVSRVGRARMDFSSGF